MLRGRHRFLRVSLVFSLRSLPVLSHSDRFSSFVDSSSNLGDSYAKIGILSPYNRRDLPVSSIETSLVYILSIALPRRIKLRLAKGILASMGVGWGSPRGGVTNSGESHFLRYYLAGLKHPVIVDVGAHLGEYANACISANPDSRIFCIEPSVDHFHSLNSRFLSSDNITCIQYALGSKDNESFVLRKDKSISGLATLVDRDLSHLDISFPFSEEVTTITGDNLSCLHSITNIDLLKIDCEGFELQILHGFRNSFASKSIRACQFERGHAHTVDRVLFKDFYDFFSKYGYHIGILLPSGSVQAIPVYDEFYENFYCSNYVAYAE